MRRQHTCITEAWLVLLVVVWLVVSWVLPSTQKWAGDGYQQGQVLQEEEAMNLPIVAASQAQAVVEHHHAAELQL
jgi:hypothetical protein